MPTSRTQELDTTHRGMTSDILTRELLEWVCHQIITCSNSKNRIELSADLLEHLYASYLDLRQDETIDTNLTCKLTIVDCILHICDRPAFMDNKEIRSEDTTSLNAQSRMKTRFHNQKTSHLPREDLRDDDNNKNKNNKSKSKEQENDDVTTAEEKFWRDNATLESFTAEQWTFFWEKLNEIWMFYNDSDKVIKKNLNDMYRNIQVKVQLYIILAWMKEKKERDQELDFLDEEEPSLERIIPSNIDNGIYLNIAKSIFPKEQNSRNRDQNLLQIFQSLLGSKQIHHNYKSLTKDYLKNEINLHDFQSDVNIVLKSLYHNSCNEIPKLELSYQQNIINFGASKDFDHNKARQSNSEKDMTVESNKTQKSSAVSVIRDDIEPDTSDEDPEEKEIMNKRKKSKLRGARERISPMPKKKMSPIPERTCINKLYNNTKPSNDANNEHLNFNNSDGQYEDFASAQGSHESKSTRYRDTETTLQTTDENAIQSKHKDFDFVSAQGSHESKSTRYRDTETSLQTTDENVIRSKDKDLEMPGVARTPSRKRRLGSTKDYHGQDGNDTEDDDHISKVLKLGSLPKKKSPSKQTQNSKNRYSNITLEYKLVTSPTIRPSKKSTRKRWTEEEKDAVKLGVAEFGVGHWAEIKQLYEHVLRDRTNVNIKDCYRTMVKRGEIE